MVFPVNMAAPGFSLNTCKISNIQMLLNNLKNNSLLVVDKNECNKITLPRRDRKSKNTDNSSHASSTKLASTETISSTSLSLYSPISFFSNSLTSPSSNSSNSPSSNSSTSLPLTLSNFLHLFQIHLSHWACQNHLHQFSQFPLPIITYLLFLHQTKSFLKLIHQMV